MALDVANPRAPWALTWAGRNLQHLHLADSQAVNLHWIPGTRRRRATCAMSEDEHHRAGWLYMAGGRLAVCNSVAMTGDDRLGVLSAPGLRQLQCLSLRGCVRLPAGALGSLAPLQHLRSLDLAGLPLLQVQPCC